MWRVLQSLLGVMILAAAARASPYEILYDPNTGLYPEETGWTRFPFYGGDIRSIEDGWLVMDGMRDPRIQDYYRMLFNGNLDPGPGEELVVSWRIRIDGLIGPYDPTVGVFSDDKWVVGFEMSRTEIASEFEQGASAAFEPGVPHTFELRSSDMRTYVLSIDGAPAIHGNFWLSLWDSRVQWGDGMYGGASLAAWDYFRISVVPECHNLELGSTVTVLVTLARARRGR